MECVGLKGAGDRVLKNKNLLFLCSGCLLRMKGEWEALTVRNEVEGSETEVAGEDTPGSDVRSAKGEEEGQGRGMEDSKLPAEVKDQSKEPQDHTYWGGRSRQS